jgi:FtsP/CotA-like multicopper oxidase with cupredoxin domain
MVDLQVTYDGEPQTLQIVGLDGVPVNSQDGAVTSSLTPVTATDILLGPGNRAEFIISPPAPGVDARLVSLPINDGPQGAVYAERILAVIQNFSFCAQTPRTAGSTVPTEIGPRGKPRFGGLALAPVAATRALYFSENFPTNPPNLLQFFVTVAGATPTLFYYNDPPAIVTNQGAVEEWTIENQTQESHIFHIHQIHFLVESFNNFPADYPNPNGIPYDQNQYLDSIVVPYWDGIHAYPSVTLKMDFRPPVVGDFVYHCHLAFHEDNGMMAVVRVMPSKTAALVERARIYLASLGVLRGEDPVEKERVLAWCYGSQIVYQRVGSREPISNRYIAGRAVSPPSTSEDGSAVGNKIPTNSLQPGGG